MEMQMGKVKQLEQTIREDLEQDHTRITERKSDIVNALAYIRQASNPSNKWNKLERSILAAMIIELTSMIDTDNQSIDILEQKISEFDR